MQTVIEQWFASPDPLKTPASAKWGEAFPPRSGAFTPEGQAIPLRGQAFPSESEPILLRGQAFASESEPNPLRGQIAPLQAIAAPAGGHPITFGRRRFPFFNPDAWLVSSLQAPGLSPRRQNLTPSLPEVHSPH